MITAIFKQRFPKEGEEMHRDTVKRLLFAQCICLAENEKIGNDFVVSRNYSETEINLAPPGQPEALAIEITIEATFDPLPGES